MQIFFCWSFKIEVKSFFAALTEDDGWTPQRDKKGEVGMQADEREVVMMMMTMIVIRPRFEGRRDM